MHNQETSKKEEQFWTQRYLEHQTGWNIGEPSTPLKTYIDQLANKDLKILIPGAGNAYEAEYLFNKGFNNVFVLDISEEPLEYFKKRVPEFPKNQVIHGDFFIHKKTYDLILEQTFFCSFPPTKPNREGYASKMYDLLNNQGKLVGLWFDFPLTDDMEKRPFGGSKAEYLNYFEPYFKTKCLETSYNSIESRESNELFGIFIKN
ncbi:MAG: methyltransferase domain-containing protein [Algibacter sp.]|uniref:methyltransferase domain-containing protein n=1 Tax=Algibacter sp. TaxID=1872428 RepID=UPI0026309760|nr:methyltransferase domain-containing protein [Algibacter sp.]MDG1729123.1 methyltransferase domain-containing protein [Algibacter sp.]MDG2179699.1 methyltransferase domain-containing protein [Algibacter sp.]